MLKVGDIVTYLYKGSIILTKIKPPEEDFKGNICAEDIMVLSGDELVMESKWGILQILDYNNIEIVKNYGNLSFDEFKLLEAQYFV